MNYVVGASTYKTAMPFGNYISVSCTPLWKSDGTNFSTQIIYLWFFVFYPSFHTWQRWGSLYEFCSFFIGFRPLVTSQGHWKGQLDQNPVPRLANLCNVHGWHRGMGKLPLLACSRNVGGWCKLLQIIKNLSSYTSRFICDFPGMLALERNYPRQLTGRLFYRLCLHGLSYRDKESNGASQNYGVVYQASTRPSAKGNTFVQPPSQNQGYRTKPMIAICHIKEITAILCHLLSIPEYILMLIYLSR